MSTTTVYTCISPFVLQMWSAMRTVFFLAMAPLGLMATELYPAGHQTPDVQHTATVGEAQHVSSTSFVCTINRLAGCWVKIYQNPPFASLASLYATYLQPTHCSCFPQFTGVAPSNSCFNQLARQGSHANYNAIRECSCGTKSVDLAFTTGSNHKTKRRATVHVPP